jgi:SAM-dependent methyltransferase
MDESIVRRLVELNKDFYERFAEVFSDSRSRPQPGYSRLLEYIPPRNPTVLDVGCGNGRFGRYLTEHGIAADYTGVDFSDSSFLRLTNDVPGRFVDRDLSQPGSLDGLGNFHFIACLSTLQHIPGRANRLRFLKEMRDILRPGGFLALANWQFMASARQRRKIVPWSEVSLHPLELEDGDYLLSWQRGGYGVRYVAYLDAEAIKEMADASELRVVSLYYSDGHEGFLNLYSILAG